MLDCKHTVCNQHDDAGRGFVPQVWGTKHPSIMPAYGTSVQNCSEHANQNVPKYAVKKKSKAIKSNQKQHKAIKSNRHQHEYNRKQSKSNQCGFCTVLKMSFTVCTCLCWLSRAFLYVLVCMLRACLYTCAMMLGGPWSRRSGGRSPPASCQHMPQVYRNVRKMQTCN